MKRFLFRPMLILILIGAQPAMAMPEGSGRKELKTKASFPSKRRMALQRKLKAQGYEVTEIPQYQIPPLLTREDLNKIVPKDVTPADSSQDILRRMSDRAVQVWLKSPSMQNMAVVQTAQKVENAMKAEVAMGDPSGEDGIQHKINFQVQAFQATSRVDYKGYVNASLSYNLRENRAGIEVREKVFKDKDLFLNHSSTSRDTLSSVGMRWSF